MKRKITIYNILSWLQ